MTNITYFYDAIRDDESISTSSPDNNVHGLPAVSVQEHDLEFSQPNTAEERAEAKVSVLSLYSVIGEACAACVKPPVELEEANEVKVSSTAIDEVEKKIKEKQDTSLLGKRIRSTKPIWLGTLQKYVQREQVAPGSINGARKDVKNLSCGSSEGEVLQCSNLKRFSYCQLQNATKNFHPQFKLGNGSGIVFKGWINEHTLDATEPEAGITIAVKRLFQEGYLDNKAWLEKVNYLGRLRHPNLARLVGYCLEDGYYLEYQHRLLVYEFTSQGSLEDVLNLLHNEEKPLSWSLLMKIALGAAKGLAFLHCAKTNVKHGNFKISNILLDRNYNTKISFALVEDGPTRPRIESSIGLIESALGVFDVMYGDTAFQSSPKGVFTAQSDVYSFGVALLQLLSGELCRNLQLLKEWANHNLKNELKRNAQYPQIKAIEVATLALQCVSEEEKLRPDMNKVVTALEKLI